MLGIDTGFAVWPATATATATVAAHYAATAGLDFRSNNTDDFTPESAFNALLGAGRLHLTVTGTPAPTSPVLTTAAYTASSPTLNAGAVYGFPIVSNTQTAPATLTVTSTSAGTLLSGTSAVTGNNINTGFRTNINLTLPVGQSAEAPTLSPCSRRIRRRFKASVQWPDGPRFRFLELYQYSRRQFDIRWRLDATVR